MPIVLFVTVEYFAFIYLLSLVLCCFMWMFMHLVIISHMFINMRIKQLTFLFIIARWTHVADQQWPILDDSIEIIVYPCSSHRLSPEIVWSPMTMLFRHMTLCFLVNFTESHCKARWIILLWNHEKLNFMKLFHLKFVSSLAYHYFKAVLCGIWAQFTIFFYIDF